MKVLIDSWRKAVLVLALIVLAFLVGAGASGVYQLEAAGGFSTCYYSAEQLASICP